MKRQVTSWDEIFAIYTSDRGWISEICKELLQFKNRREIYHWQKAWIGETQIANEYVERCSISVAITEKQIKTIEIKTLGLQKLDVR